MANINYTAALKYIDLGENDKAIEKLLLAIEQETEKGNEMGATEYRCVLGEFYANIGMSEHAREQFELVLNYCDANLALPRQRLIAKTSLDIIDGKIKPERKKAPHEVNSAIPLVRKPVQDKAFIAKQLGKK